jgi:hypothetical protein
MSYINKLLKNNKPKEVKVITEKQVIKKQKKKRRKINYEKLIIEKYIEDEDYNNWIEDNLEDLEDLYYRFEDYYPNLNQEKFFLTIYLNKDNLIW